MDKIVLITGATSGIGESTADVFAKNGYRVIITGRRKNKLEDLSNKLQSKYQAEVLILNFDVRMKDEVGKVLSSIPEKWKNIDVLVNNAGLAVGLDKIQDGNDQDWDTMIDTNVKGLLYVTKAIIPLFIKQGKGHIINVASTAAKVVYEKGNVYCASKFAVDALSKSMRIDLLSENIKVTQISPGAAETEFSLVRFKGNEEKASNTYNGFEPLKAIDIAENIYYVTTLPEHVCINELEITATAQANSTHIFKQ